MLLYVSLPLTYFNYFSFALKKENKVLVRTFFISLKLNVPFQLICFLFMIQSSFLLVI